MPKVISCFNFLFNDQFLIEPEQWDSDIQNDSSGYA